ncbi:MAG: restriction endonuclease subunit S [Bacteroidales bacterium]|nr:restriction endonuclease subunit S [Bacteroidales bacterium]
MNDNKQHIPQGYKNSPLGIIPNDWEVKRLGDLCFDIFSGSNKTRTDSGKYTVYGSTGIIGKTDEYKYEGEKILVARVGAHAGQVSLASGKYDVSDNTIIVENQDCFSLFFAYQYLIASNLNKMVFGSGQPLITSGMLKRMFVVYPPFEEQIKINAVLQLWDTAIEKQTQLIEKLTLRKRALMQQLLTGKKRLKGFDGEWNEVKLGEIFDERNETKCDNLPLLSITGDKGVIYQSESDKRDISNEDKSKYKRICPNDIGYNTMRMWQGRSALSELEGVVSPAYTIVTPRNNVDVRFMSMLIQRPRIVYGFWTHSQGLVSDTLNCKYPDFCQVKVVIPSKKEQTAIADFFIEVNKEIELANKKLRNLQTQKRGLMQVLLTGKKRIK